MAKTLEEGTVPSDVTVLSQSGGGSEGEGGLSGVSAPTAGASVVDLTADRSTRGRSAADGEGLVVVLLS